MFSGAVRGATAAADGCSLFSLELSTAQFPIFLTLITVQARGVSGGAEGAEAFTGRLSQTGL